jgi:polyhydroxyalkanoate synthesis regulator phasin
MTERTATLDELEERVKQLEGGYPKDMPAILRDVWSLQERVKQLEAGIQQLANVVERRPEL